jgi:hypothetical protein
VADTQFRLRGTDPVSCLFQTIAEQGHYAGRRVVTRQGIYVCTPDGEFLASTEPADADAVLALMQRGLQLWRERGEDGTRAAPALAHVPVAEDSYPVEGLVLELAVRDLSDHEIDDRRSRSSPIPHALNFDHLWFSKSEATQWIPDETDVGAARPLPDELVTRIACLHLLDSVGCVLPRRFQPEDVDDSWIRTEVVARTGHRIELRITGSTRVHARGREVRCYANRIETSILGYATFDVASEAFTRFEAIALGRCTEFRSAAGDSTSAKELGFAFTLAELGEPHTPPLYFRRYDADWDASVASMAYR